MDCAAAITVSPLVFIFGRMVCRRSASFLAQALAAARYAWVAAVARSMAACSSGVVATLRSEA